MEQVEMRPGCKPGTVSVLSSPDSPPNMDERQKHVSHAFPERATATAISQRAAIKRVFSFAQIFFFSIAFMSSWEATLVNLSAVFWNGGPETLAWGCLIVVVGALAQSASLAEMASIQPIAGAQYHWTHFLAPPRHRRFITWMQGWVTWFAWVSVLAGILNITAYAIQGLVEMNYPDYTPQRYQLTLMVIAILVLETLMNIYIFWLIPWIELLAGLLHIVLFIVFVVVLVTLAPRHSTNFVFFDRATASGWDNGFISWNLGLLTPMWGFIGFDGAVHMSEEVRKAKQAVPRTMFFTILLNGILAYAMSIVILYTMGSLDAVVNSSFPILEVCRQATGSASAATGMVSALLVVQFAATLATVASVSRLTWAWARDGGLPVWFSVIHPRHRVPIRAIVLPVALVMLLSLLNIASTAAFGAFIALSSLGLMASYSIAIGCMLHARFRKEPVPFGAWTLGRWGLPINIFALVFTLYITVFLPFPSTLPVTGTNMNYALPIFVFTTGLALGLWFFWAKKHWRGLDLDIIEYVLAEGEEEEGGDDESGSHTKESVQ